MIFGITSYRSSGSRIRSIESCSFVSRSEGGFGSDLTLILQKLVKREQRVNAERAKGPANSAGKPQLLEAQS